MSDGLRTPSLRRFTDARYQGSFGISAREGNHYAISVWRRRNTGILGIIHAKTLQDSFHIIRRLRHKYPDRMLSISRTSYGSRRWKAPDYRPPYAPPDHRSFRRLSLYERKGARWIRRSTAPDVLAILDA